MNTFQTFFSKLSAKSQPEVALSQEIAGLASSFGSFSSAADSLIHENNAIFIPNCKPNQDFCLTDEMDPILISSPSLSSTQQHQCDPSLQLLSTSTCESDISFYSPTTPHHCGVSSNCNGSGMLSPYTLPSSYTFPNYEHHGLSSSHSSCSSSSSTNITAASPGTSLANAMHQGLTIQSPSTTPLINVNDIMVSPSLSSYPPFSPFTATSTTFDPTMSPSLSGFSIGNHHHQSDVSTSTSSFNDNNNINDEWLLSQWQSLQNNMNPIQNILDLHSPIITTTVTMTDSTGTISHQQLQQQQDDDDDDDEEEEEKEDFENSIKKNKKTITTIKKNIDHKINKKPPTRHGKFHCPHCTRTSNRSNNMKEHILTHDPNRPKNFACGICSKRFARKHDLKRHHESHVRNIHKIIKDWGFIPFKMVDTTNNDN
ncbi:unnamed protein product [Cunninghamella echinulata]